MYDSFIMVKIGSKPLIIVNFKDYPEAIGDGAFNLAKIHQEVAKEFLGKVDLAVCIHPTDLRNICAKFKDLIVLSQSGDAYTRNSDGSQKKTQTGRMTPNVVSLCGARGILVNHAENPRTNEEIKAILEDFKGANPDFIVVVCAESAERAWKIKEMCGDFQPTFIALEPPELIGGDISVTTRPEVISGVCEGGIDNLLVGAGVKTGEDISKALELGAEGVLLASGVVKSKNATSEEVLRELASAIK